MMRFLRYALLGLALTVIGVAVHAAGTQPTGYQFPMSPWNAYAPGRVQCGQLIGANMNVTTDQTIQIQAPSTNYYLDSIIADAASVSLTTAAGGIYTAASKGGVAVVAATQAYSVLTAAAANAAGSALALTLDATLAKTAKFNLATLYFSLTTGQGAAATANIRIYCQPLYPG